MKILMRYTTLLPIFLHWALSIDSFGQGCNVAVSPGTTICANQTVSFGADCTSGESNSWVITNQTGTVYSEFNSGTSMSYAFTTPGTYTVIYSYSQQNCRWEWDNDSGQSVLICDEVGDFGSVIITVTSSFNVPIISTSSTVICGPANVLLNVSNPQSDITYNWSSNTSSYAPTGISVSFPNVNSNTTFTVVASNASGQCLLMAMQDIEVQQTLVSPSIASNSGFRQSALRATPFPFASSHYWQTSSTGTSVSSPVSGDYAIIESGNYFIRSFRNNCWTTATGPVQVQIDVTPPLTTIVQVPKAGYSEILQTNNDLELILQYADYYWVSDPTSNATILGSYNNSSKIFENGTYYLRGKDRGTGTLGPTLTLNVQLGNFDNGLNWVFSRSFDGNMNEQGDLRILSESKNYFDQRGQALQSQVKTYHNNQPHVFASQPLKDKYDRTVGSTMSAPIALPDFKYNSAFTLTTGGKPFGYNDFDKPNIFSTENKGTLGNYYSVQNKWGETNVPTTSRTYSRTDHYEDGTGEERKSAQPGDIHFIGSGREVLKGTFPVGNDPAAHELKDYLSKRSIVFGGVVQPSIIEGVQTVVRDENERYVVSISDKSGKVLMTARKGTKLFTSSVSSDKMAYFYVLGGANSNTQSITIDGTVNYTIENTITNTTITKLTSALPHTYTLAAGFYRVLPSTGTVKVSYTNYFSDIAYQFYNDAGRLVVSVSPNGYEQWMSGTAYADIDKSTHTYNHQGWLLSMTEKDAGTTNYLYRRDGKIRFSQNAQQKEDELNNRVGKGRFSYTNYDDLGRPVESGAYIGSSLTYSSLNATLEFSAQVNYVLIDKTDWVKTYYDFPNSPPVPSFSQEYVRGAVSYTENANTKTWYSYDELGRVVWMAQQPTAFPYAFVTQYEYDFLGNVLTTSTKAYSGSTSRDAFYHHYEYDRNKRLKKVYTSLDGTKKTLQAEYIYYLHGPLKRVVLATNLQGIDFVYNIHGWLTQINHPDDTDLSKDPGHDGTNGVRKDVFGMILEYYERSMTPTVSSLEPSRFHKLPLEGEGMKQSLALQTDPMTLYKTMLRSSMEAIRNKNFDNGTKAAGPGGQ
jgi:Ig-like domain CHU_C associated